MKAIVRDSYGSPDVLGLREVQTPEPGDDEVLVRVHASSVNSADLDYMRGFPLVARIGTGLRRPRSRVLGFDVAGTVERIGEKVTQLRPGDEVWADLSQVGPGAFAEYVGAPELVFTEKPAGVSFEEAATIPHSGILALQGLRGKGPISPGEKVLINGAGGCVGPFAVQIAKSSGAEVTGVDHTGKLDMIRSLGADHVIDYTREDFTSNGLRYDLILDIAGHRSILRYRRSLGPEGRYVMIAHSLARFFGAFIWGALIQLFSRKRMGVFMWRPNSPSDLEYLRELLDTGKIKPLIDRRYELAQVPDALRYLEQGLARGKLVINP